MIEETIRQLPCDTVRLISSTQIVTCVSSVVKELFENSLDAGANNIQVKLENYGLDLIEVKDDGPGLDYGSVQKMFLSGYTSKISNFQDLNYLQTYGFRGEALSAICKLGETSITTKTEKDTLGMTYLVKSNGAADNSKPSHILRGTIISVKNIFSTLPVRKQYSSSKKKMLEELKKVENILHALSVIHPSLRVTLIHNKSSIWQKNSVKSLKQSYMQVVGLKVASRMEYVKEEKDNMLIELIVPKKDIKELDGLFLSSMHPPYVHVNKRPVLLKDVTKIIAKHICDSHQENEVTNKFPFFLASITVPPEVIDVNLEPNKTKILIKILPEVLSLISEMLNRYYDHSIHIPLSHCKSPEELLDDDVDGAEETPLKKTKLDHLATIPTQIENASINREWTLNIVNDEPNDILAEDLPCTSNIIDTICSQINKDNCILSTEAEEAQLTDRLINSGNKLVANVKINGTNDAINDNALPDLNQKYSTAQIWGNGLSLADRINLIPSPITVCNEQPDEESLRKYTVPSEKVTEDAGTTLPILPDWPIRQITPKKTCYGNSLDTSKTPVYAENQMNFEKAQNNSCHDSVVNKLVEPSKKIVSECPFRLSSPTTGLDVVFSSNAVNRKNVSVSRGEIDNTNETVYEKSSIADTSSIQDEHSEKISAVSWSRGQVKMKDGHLLEGGAAVVICPRMTEDAAQFDLSLRSVSSQMGKKELSGFTKFARIMRPKITSEEPGILFTEVSKLLVKRWRELSADEKEYYEDLSKVIDQERNVHKQQKETVHKTLKRGSATELLTRTKKMVIKRPERFKTTFNISMETVKSLKMKSEWELNPAQITLIGKINNEKDWLYFKNNEIGYLRHMGLQELVLFYRMMNNLEISRKKLQNHQFLTEELLGPQAWETLLSLPNEYKEESCKNVILSEVIVKNGFHVELLPSASGKFSSALLTEVAACIESSGVSDLKEVLYLFHWHGNSGEMFDFRPNAVKDYIMSEVKRIVSENLPPPSEAEVKNLLHNWENIKHLPPKCLHGREVLVPFHAMKTNVDQV